jgi:flagellar basal-body rod protein FlgB
MWLTDVSQTGVDAALEKVMAFSEGRHRVLAENIANIDTPGYRAKQLDPKLFQSSLLKAIQEKGGGRDTPLRIEATRQFHTDEQEMLQVTPTLKPPENVLFHDGTNASIERQMAQLAENALMYQAAVELQRQRIALIKQAIAGRL